MSEWRRGDRLTGSCPGGFRGKRPGAGTSTAEALEFYMRRTLKHVSRFVLFLRGAAPVEAFAAGAWDWLGGKMGRRRNQPLVRCIVDLETGCSFAANDWGFEAAARFTGPAAFSTVGGIPCASRRLMQGPGPNAILFSTT